MGPVGGGVGGMVGPVGVGGGGGGSDVELVSKTLQFEHKLFYFDLKENPRGRYLKISEKTSTTRSTIIVPIAGVAWFLDLFDYYIRTDERDVFSKELRLDTKVFYFDIGENKRGRYLKVCGFSKGKVAFSSSSPGPLKLDSFFSYVKKKKSIKLYAEHGPTPTCQRQRSSLTRLQIKRLLWALNPKVSEASVNRNRSTIIVPAGSSGEEGWEAFRNVLLEINDEASRLYVLPNHPSQQHLEPPERLPGLSDDVGAGFIAGHGSQSASVPEVDVDGPPIEEFSGMGLSKVAGADRSSIILPLSGLKQFHEMVGHFVDIMKDRLEGMTGANVRTVEPSQR
uniref:Transcription factor Pur-alpha 1 n=1 Tax=Aegilops tauschii TaxID=37682 RepID=M8BPD1_AEGTA